MNFISNKWRKNSKNNFGLLRFPSKRQNIKLSKNKSQIPTSWQEKQSISITTKTEQSFQRLTTQNAQYLPFRNPKHFRQNTISFEHRLERTLTAQLNGLQDSRQLPPETVLQQEAKSNAANIAVRTSASKSYLT